MDVRREPLPRRVVQAGFYAHQPHPALGLQVRQILDARAHIRQRNAARVHLPRAVRVYVRLVLRDGVYFVVG